MIRELTDDDFKSAIQTGLVLADFYGTWCPPCTLLDPVVEQLAADYDGRVTFVKINVDDNAESAVDNTVEDIPTLIFFRNGEEQLRLFGAQKYETLAGELDRLLAEK